MKALRIKQKPKNGLLVIHLPENFRKHELMEIIILPYEEETIPAKKIDVKKLKGSVDLNMTVEEIEHECERMRAEWNRGF